MAVRQGHELLELLGSRLGECDGVDIAVAWAAPCRAIDELGEFCAGGGFLRVAVGIDGHATNPAALRQLAGFGQLRIGAARAPATGIFHPKYSCFHRGAGSTVWIGSANLTRGGFGGNDELVLERAGGEDSLAWFELLWSSLASDPAEEIAAYERDWRPPPASGIGRTAGARRQRKQPGRIAERLDATWSWDDYVINVRARHDEMVRARPENTGGKLGEPLSVFGEHESWLETIRIGRPVTRLSSWRSLETWQTDVLLGRGRYGALGTLGGSGVGTKSLLGRTAADRDAREEILGEVHAASEAGIDVIQAGVSALAGIGRRDHVGVGVATRLLALARPDRYVSVNGASQEALATYSGLPRRTRRVKADAPGAAWQEGEGVAFVVRSAGPVLLDAAVGCAGCPRRGRRDRTDMARDAWGTEGDAKGAATCSGSGQGAAGDQAGGHGS